MLEGQENCAVSELIGHAQGGLQRQLCFSDSRRPGDHDKRQRIISITPSGAQLTTTLIDEATALEREALADVDDLAALSQQLRDLTAAVEARAQTIQPNEQAG